MATILRQPLFSPNRALNSRHDESIQNLQQTTLKVVAVLVLPFLNVDLDRPHALTQSRYDPIGTNYQQFLVPPATDPAVNVWYSRPVRLEPRKDESAEKNYQLFPAVIVTKPVINTEFGRPGILRITKDTTSGLNVPVTFPPPATTPFSKPDLGARAQLIFSKVDGPLGSPLQIVFPPPVTKPFVQPDLNARAQSPYQRVEGPLGSPLLIPFPPPIIRALVQPDLSARPQSIYRRIDGPLGRPLLLAFPLPPSVLPFNTHYVSGRAINRPVTGQDVLSVNVQLFPPSSAYTPASVTVEAFRVGFYGGLYRYVGDRFQIVTPYEWSPYWMSAVDTPPANWLPLFAGYNVEVDHNILFPTTDTEAAAWAAAHRRP